MNRRDFLKRNTTVAFSLLLNGGTVAALEALLPEELPNVLPPRDRHPNGAPRALYLRSFEAWGCGAYGEPTRVLLNRAAAHFSMTFAQGAIPPLMGWPIDPHEGHVVYVSPTGLELVFINDDYPLVSADPWIEWETVLTELGSWPRMVELQGWREGQAYAARYFATAPATRPRHYEEWDRD